MQVRIKWLEKRVFEAETGSGHILTMDGPPEHGGSNLAARPMEMILVGLGGCSAFDVVEILQKSRQIVKDCHIVTGVGLNEKHVKRAVELSIDKYCSVAKMLRPDVEINYDYEIS